MVNGQMLDIPLKVMLPGDVILFRGKSGFSRLIRRMETAPGEKTTIFNHVGVAVDALQLVEALDKVRLNKIISRAVSGDDEIAIFRNTALSFPQRQELKGIALDYVGRGYGWVKIGLHAADYWLSKIIGCDTVFFRKLANLKKYPICSWVVGFAYAKIGIRFGRDADVVQPDDIGDYVQNHDDWALVWCSTTLRRVLGVVR